VGQSDAGGGISRRLGFASGVAAAESKTRGARRRPRTLGSGQLGRVFKIEKFEQMEH